MPIIPKIIMRVGKVRVGERDYYQGTLHIHVVCVCVGRGGGGGGERGEGYVHVIS